MFVNIQSCEVVKNKIMHLRKCILFYFKDTVNNIAQFVCDDDYYYYDMIKVFECVLKGLIIYKFIDVNCIYMI